jgi:hypothetical protein
MVVNFIINTMITFVIAIFSPLPTVPATPQAIIDGGAWVTTTIGEVISVLNMLYTPTLLAACMIVIIAAFNFEMIYHAIMWILRKIPMINMK